MRLALVFAVSIASAVFLPEDAQAAPSANGCGSALSGLMDAGSRSLASLTTAVDEALRFETEAEGTGELSEAARLDVIAKGVQVDVPSFLQDGPTCGLYALKMVMSAHWRKDPTRPSPAARAGEWGTGGEPIYERAVARNWLWGEGDERGGSTPWALARLAKSYGYQAKPAYLGKNLARPTIADLKAQLAAGVPPIVATSGADDHGDPTLSSPLNAEWHWVVVEGFHTRGGVEYVIVQHGNSTEPEVWRASDFEKSWAGCLYASVYVRP